MGANHGLFFIYFRLSNKFQILQHICMWKSIRCQDLNSRPLEMVNTGPGLPPLIAVDLASANRILCLKGCFKTGQSRPLFVFSFFSHSISNDKYLIWSIQIEKSLTLCLGFDPGSPERRCWRFHWAMAAALFKMYFLTFNYLFQLNGMMV